MEHPLLCSSWFRTAMVVRLRCKVYQLGNARPRIMGRIYVMCHALILAGLVLPMKCVSGVVTVNVCEKPSGKFGRNATSLKVSRKSESWQLSLDKCFPNGDALLLNLTEMKAIRYTSCSAKVILSVPDVEPKELCKEPTGQCILIMAHNNQCFNTSATSGCPHVSLYNVAEVFPITVGYKLKFFWSDWWANFEIEYALLTSFHQTKTTALSTPEPITTKPKIQTTESVSSIQSTKSSTSFGKTTSFQDPGNDCQRDENNMDRNLAIVFGTLFAITLAALIATALRLSREINQENRGGEARNTGGEPDAVYSVVNNNAARGGARASSEREMVVNELYQM